MRLANAVPCLYLPGFILFLVIAPTLAQTGDKSGCQLRTKADEIRASASRLMKLGRIPWVTDPDEGFRLAKDEQRPVFLYVQAGDPLEDC